MSPHWNLHLVFYNMNENSIRELDQKNIIVFKKDWIMGMFWEEQTFGTGSFRHLCLFLCIVLSTSYYKHITFTMSCNLPCPYMCILHIIDEWFTIVFMVTRKIVPRVCICRKMISFLKWKIEIYSICLKTNWHNSQSLYVPIYYNHMYSPLQRQYFNLLFKI